MKGPTTMRHDIRSKLGAFLVALCVSAPLVAQTPGGQRLTAPEDDVKKEMKELFQKVERRLREIDRLLSDASAGDLSAVKADHDSGMNALLKNSEERGRDVLAGIDRILELAKQLGEQQSGSGSGGSGQEKPGEGQGSPLDQRGQQSAPRESTPSGPESGDKPDGQKPQGEKPGGEKPENQPQGNDPKPGDGMPKDNRTAPDDPRNSPGSKPPGAAGDGSSRVNDGKDRWGELPVHARDVFRIEGGGDMPVQYRDWIDSYYRRLNKKP